MNIRRVNRAARALTAAAAVVAVGTLGLGSAYASEVPATEDLEQALASEETAAPVPDETDAGTEVQDQGPEGAPDTAQDATPEATPDGVDVVDDAASAAAEEATEEAEEELENESALPGQLVVTRPPSTVWAVLGDAPVTISAANSGEASAPLNWVLERVGGEVVASGQTQMPGGGQTSALYSGDLALGQYHFLALNENVENGDFTFEVAQILIESVTWEQNPVNADEATGVADAVLIGVVTGQEGDGVHATVTLVEKSQELQAANGSEIPLTLEADGTFRHTFVGLEPGIYAPTVRIYLGDSQAYSYESDYLEVRTARSGPVVAEAAFDPVEASVCPGDVAGSTVTGRITNWHPDYKVAVQFFADYDLDEDDFELLEEEREVYVDPDGTFSYTIQRVGVGTYSADITVYTGNWDDNEWLDIKGFVPFTVTEKECDTPGGETPGGETPGGETPGGETPGGQTPGDQTPADQTSGGQTSVTTDKNPTTKPASTVSYQKTLPKTGVSAAGLLAVLGIGLVGTGAATLAWRRRAQ